MADRTLALYGRSGTYKTANCGFVAQYIYEKYGKKTRYIYADGGSFAHIKPLADVGILEPLVIVDDPNPMAVIKGILIDKLWPVDINKDFKRTSPKTTTDMKDVGAYIIEGITSLAELLQSKYRGIKTGMSPAYTETVDKALEGMSNHRIGSLSMDSYGIIQQEMGEIITRSWQLPVPFVMYTGHEAQGEDEQTRKAFRGIALVGNAATSKIGKRIGTMIHAQQVPKSKESLELETRYYFQSHADPIFKEIAWEAKARVPANRVDDLLKTYPGGFFVPDKEHGLDDYMRIEDKLMETQLSKLEEWKSKVDKSRG